MLETGVKRSMLLSEIGFFIIIIIIYKRARAKKALSEG